MIRKALDVRPDEWKLTGAAIVINLVLLCGIKIFVTSLMSFYTQTYEASTIPLMFLLANACMIPVSLGVVSLQARFTIQRLLIPLMLFFIGGTVVFSIFLGLYHNQWAWLFPMGFIWGELLLRLLPIWFISYLYNLFDIRQIKRLFSIIDSGRSLGNIVLIVIVPGLISGVGVAWLPLVGALILLGQFVFYPALIQSAGDPTRDEGGRPPEPETPFKIQALFKTTYLLWIAGFVTGWIFFSYFSNQLLLSSLKNEFSTESMTVFLSGFYSIVFSIRLVLEIFVSSRAVRKLGILFGLLIQPVVLTGVALLSLVVPMAWHSWTFIILAGLLFQLDAFYHITINLMYQPLALKFRQKAQVYIKGVFARWTSILTCLGLLGLTWGLGAEGIDLSWVLVVFGVGWIICGWFLKKKYVDQLILSFDPEEKEEDLNAIQILDPKNKQWLLQQLESPVAAEVLHALRILKQQDWEDSQDVWLYCVFDVLDRSEISIQLEALQIMETQGTHQWGWRLWEERYPMAPDSLKSYLIQTFAALCHEESVPQLLPLLNDSNPEIQEVAMASLCRFGGLEGVFEAADSLKTLIRSDVIDNQIRLANIIHRIGSPTFFTPLLPLLQHRSFRVKKAAIQAAGVVQHPRLSSELLSHLAQPQTQRYAIHALGKWGDLAVGDMEMIYSKDAQNHRFWQKGVVLALSKIGTPLALQTLQRITEQTESLRLQQTLVRQWIDFHPAWGAQFSRNALSGLRQTTMEHISLLFLSLDTFRKWDFAKLLTRGLLTEIHHSKTLLLNILGLQYGVDEFLRLRLVLLGNTTGNQQAQGLELLENLLPRSEKTYVLPFFESSRLPAPSKKIPFKQDQLVEHLLFWLHHSQHLSTWTQILILLTITLLVKSHMDSEQKSELLISVQQDARFTQIMKHLIRQSLSPIVAEAALEAWKTVHPGQPADVILDLSQCPFPNLSRLDMPQTLEKLLLLKQMAIFEQADDEFFNELLHIAEEVRLPANETLFEEGAVCQAMYVVVKGKVKAWKGETSIGVWERGTSFGEYEVLGKINHSATLKTLEASTLLKIKKEDLKQLLSLSGEFAENLIYYLVQTLRAKSEEDHTNLPHELSLFQRLIEL